MSEFFSFPEGYRSGFACFVGRPNAGKSTLTNALVGRKIVITSDKPQTTRTVVRGIVHRGDGQLILVDTPGLHRPRTLLGDLLIGMMPEGPPLYPDGDLTDAPEEILAAELIREAALDGVRDELPHSIAVVVDEMALREDRPEDKPLLDISASLYVERSSQKGIMIGHQGARLRQVGTVARQQIEALLGTPVYLDLRVKIAKDWQRDPKQLRKLGF